VQLVWLWTHTAVLTPNHYSSNYTGYQYAREFCSKWLSWPVRHTQPAQPHTSASTFINAPQLTPHVRHHSHWLPFQTRQLCLHAKLLTTQHRQRGRVFLHILTCDSESGFKRLLKTHLFNNCFNVAWLTHSQRLCSSAYGALQIFLWYDIKQYRAYVNWLSSLRIIYLYTLC